MERGLPRLKEYKKKILQAIISDDLLVRAIANSQENCLDIPFLEPATLLYAQIFPYKWTLSEIPTNKEVYITMSFAVDRLEGGYFNNIAFDIYILINKDLMRIKTDEGYELRSDYIMERLEKLFLGSREFGLGKLKLVDVGELFVTTQIPGFYLTFTTVDQAGR